jgi:tetratricopeptide (TPR) repeat protein
MGEDEGQDELVTEEMLWDRIPEVDGAERASTYYELSARIYARGQYDEALALAETACDIYSTLGANAPSEGLAQAYYEKVISTMEECAQEHLVDGNEIGAANDLHLIGCAYRDLKKYDEAIGSFQEARALYKSNKEVIHVARCDQKIASCYVEIGNGEAALLSARKALDVFETAHDHLRETFALFEYGKAQVLLGKLEEGLDSLDTVLQTATEEDPKDFEFIVDIESRMAAVMRTLGRDKEADEIERRLASVRDAMIEDANNEEERA